MYFCIETTFGFVDREKRSFQKELIAQSNRCRMSSSIFINSNILIHQSQPQLHRVTLNMAHGTYKGILAIQMKADLTPTLGI